MLRGQQHGGTDSQVSSSFMSVSGADPGAPVSDGMETGGLAQTQLPHQQPPSHAPPMSTSFISHAGASAVTSSPLPQLPSPSSSTAHVDPYNQAVVGLSLPIGLHSSSTQTRGEGGVDGHGGGGHSVGKVSVADRIRVVVRLKPQLKRVPKAYLPYSIHCSEMSGVFPRTNRNNAGTSSPLEEGSHLPFLSLFTDANGDTTGERMHNSGSGGSSPNTTTAAITTSTLHVLSIVPPGVKSGSSAAAVTSAAAAASSTFVVNQVLDAGDTDDKMCGELVHPLLHRVRQGKSSTVLLHGPSGSGKTHTLNIAASGLAQGLFTSVLNPSTDILEMSYLQIQDNRAYHLIGPSPAPDRLGAPLPPPTSLQDGTSSLFQPKVVVHSVEEVREKLKTAESLKCTTSHALNARSSCSHCMLTFTITRYWKGSPLITVSVTLVDLLAQSEASYYVPGRMGNVLSHAAAPLSGLPHSSGSASMPPSSAEQQERQLAFQQFFTSLFYPLADSERNGTHTAHPPGNRPTNASAAGRRRSKERSNGYPLPSSAASHSRVFIVEPDPSPPPTPSSALGHVVAVPLIARYLAPLLQQDDMLVVVVLFVSLEVQHYPETRAVLQLGQEIHRGTIFPPGRLHSPLGSSLPPRVRWGDPGAVPVSRLTFELEAALTALQKEADTVRKTLSVERLLRTTTPPLYLAGSAFEKLSSELVLPTPMNPPATTENPCLDSTGAASGSSGMVISTTIAPILLTSVNKESLCSPAWSPSANTDLAGGGGGVESQHARIISPNTSAFPSAVGWASGSKSPAAAAGGFLSESSAGVDRLCTLEHHEKLLTSAENFIQNELHRLVQRVSSADDDVINLPSNAATQVLKGAMGMLKNGAGATASASTALFSQQAPPHVGMTGSHDLSSSLLSSVLPDRSSVHGLVKELQGTLDSLPVVPPGCAMPEVSGEAGGIVSPAAAAAFPHLEQVMTYLLRCEALLESSMEENEILQHRMRSLRREGERTAEEVLAAKRSLVEANVTMCQLLVHQSRLEQEKKRVEGYLEEMEMELYRECASQAVRQDTLLLFHRKQSMHIEERRELQKQVDSHRRNAESLQSRLVAMEKERDQCLQAKARSENEIKRREEAFKAVWKLLTPYQKARFNDYGSIHDSPESVSGSGSGSGMALNALKRRRSQSAVTVDNPMDSGGGNTGLPNSSNNSNSPVATNLLAQNHELLVLRSQLKEVQRLLEDTRNCGKERDGVIEDLKAEGRRMSVLMEKKDTHYARLKKERDTLREYAEHMETQLVEAVVHSHRQVERLKMFREDIRVLQEEKHRLEASGEEYVRENNRLQEMVVSLRMNMESQSSQIVGLQEHIQQINAERAQQNFHRQLYYESRIKELEKQLLEEKKNGKSAKRSGARGSLEGPPPMARTNGNNNGTGMPLSLRMQNLRGKRRMRSAHQPARSSTGSNPGSSAGKTGSGLTAGSKVGVNANRHDRHEPLSTRPKTRVLISSDGRQQQGNPTMIHSGGPEGGSVVSLHGADYYTTADSAGPPHSVRIARTGPVPQWE